MTNIGIFDSGLGGVAVLNELRQIIFILETILEFLMEIGLRPKLQALQLTL